MPAEAPLGAFLKEQDLAHLYTILEPHGLEIMTSLLGANRPVFLARIKEWGVVKLGDRQKLANELGKLIKEGRAPTSAAAQPIPHLVPCVWTQTNEVVTVRLRVPGGLDSRKISFNLDMNSMEVLVNGEKTSLAGRLIALVKAAESTWELERSHQDEPEMYEQAASRIMRDDTVVVTLYKVKAEEWRTLFAGGEGVSARKERLPEPAPKKEKKKKAVEGAGASPCSFVPRKLRLGADKDKHDAKVAQSKADKAGPQASGQGNVSARDHWQSASARFLWANGTPMRSGSPDGTEPALFTWTEDATQLVLRAETRPGLRRDELSLHAHATSVELQLGGTNTPWCGHLVGRVEPRKCDVRVIPGVDGISDTLELTLVKADKRLWRAPFKDLIDKLDERERARGRQLPRRDELMAGEWRCAQAGGEWQIFIPITWGVVDPADLRVAVTTDSLNVHIAGADETPLLGGELYGKIHPADCTFKITPPSGKKKNGEMEIHIVKNTAAAGVGGQWSDLIKMWYG